LIQLGADGLVLRQTKHRYLECHCVCGHWTHAEAVWAVASTERHPASPTLAALICFLTQRMRLLRARVREFLFDRLGLAVSTAAINQCVHEAGRAVPPVVTARIAVTIRKRALLQAIETVGSRCSNIFGTSAPMHSARRRRSAG
jgi:hypothetical protein